MPKVSFQAGSRTIGGSSTDHERRPFICADAQQCSRTKQASDLDFFTAHTISPSAERKHDTFFMKFCGPKALTQQATENDDLPH